MDAEKLRQAVQAVLDAEGGTQVAVVAVHGFGPHGDIFTVHARAKPTEEPK